MSSIPSQPHQLADAAASGLAAELELADTVAEVIALTRAFVESWSAPEILRLPFYCRPGRITTTKEIEELAFLLEHAQAHFSGRLVDGLVLDRMATFFAAAARAIDRATL
jgi:hypothetical protein